jgi:DNA polymerase
MRTVVIKPEFSAWRDVARVLLAAGVRPAEILWSDQPNEVSLFDNDGIIPVDSRSSGRSPRVPAAFLDLARSAAAHRDPQRWAILYQVLWRLTHGGERLLLEVATDPDLRRIRNWAKAVGRDIHKMHAFVRFRLVDTDAETGRECFVAWFEPEYRIIRLAAGFFRKRFAGMDWSILTPDECAHWDGEDLHFTPGVPADTAPGEDELDELWRGYYRSIFNPARVKVRAMQSEMPKKYWKNLPEARLIHGLIADSGRRVHEMLETEGLPARPKVIKPCPDA